METLNRRWSAWWLTPVADGRVHVLRLIAYGFIPVDVLWTTAWVAQHRYVPGELYRPLLIGRLLPIPTVTADWVTAVQAALLTSAALALLATARRWSAAIPLGWVVAATYVWWMVIGMSYGKVDHDRFAFIILLFVLPTVRVVPDGSQRSEAAGWAIRMVHLGIVVTYALSAWAKVRFGGWDWANGATLARAVIRRGTELADLALQHPDLMRGIQWFTIVFEACSILLLIAKPPWVHAVVAALVAFHVVTFLTLGIIFLPHLVALTALLPLERLLLVGRDQHLDLAH